MKQIVVVLVAVLVATMAVTGRAQSPDYRLGWGTGSWSGQANTTKLCVDTVLSPGKCNSFGWLLSTVTLAISDPLVNSNVAAVTVNITNSLTVGDGKDAQVFIAKVSSKLFQATYAPANLYFGLNITATGVLPTPVPPSPTSSPLQQSLNAFTQKNLETYTAGLTYPLCTINSPLAGGQCVAPSTTQLGLCYLSPIVPAAKDLLKIPLRVHLSGCYGGPVEGAVAGIITTLLFIVSVLLAFVFSSVKGQGVGVEHMPAVSGH